jgi:acetylornithine deacetylase/succinyl-diaminopimelate desuccinylase-like protein
MAQDARFKNIKYCINLEPTELKIVHAHKGQIHLTIRAHGKAAHASDPSKGDNAILKLNEAINNLRKFGDRLAEFEHGLLGRPAMNIGVIKGGTASNIVPDFAEMEVDVRIVPGQDGKKIVEEIKKVVSPLEVIVNHIYSPVEMPASSPFIENFRKILKAEGVDSEPEIGGYTTEFSDLAEAEIEGFIFGAGSINQAHKIDEFVEVGQIERLCKILCKFLGSRES